MSRPKGSKDKTKRATRDAYSRKDVIYVNNLFASGMTTKEIHEETKWSYNQLKKMRIKPDLNAKEMARRLDETSSDKICGVYAIAFFNPARRTMWYIGSSVDVYARIKSHKSALSSQRHYNKKMQELFNKSIPMVAFLFKECEESDLIALENSLINQYCKGCMINAWSLPENMKEFYVKAAKSFSADKYTVEGDCWIYNRNHRGYGGSIQISIDRVKKYLQPHRVSFFIKTGKIPTLVRHKCNNGLCVNPDHLDEGSYADNSKDFIDSKTHKEKKKKQEKEFETLWIQHNGDIGAIASKTSYGKNRCYYYQKILKLKDKYPNITEEKYRVIKERNKKSSRGRGPQKASLKDKVINDWKCIDEWVSKHSHKWECVKCGNIRYTSKAAIKKFQTCKRCKNKGLAIDILSYIPDISRIQASGITIGVYHFNYEELI